MNKYMKNDPLRVAINAQILPNSGAGGVISVLVGLITALGKLEDGLEEYVIVGPWNEPDWLQPYLGPSQILVRGTETIQQLDRKPGPLEPIKRIFGPLRPFIRAIWRELFPIPQSSEPSVWPDVPVSKGFYEGLKCHVIHFPWPSFTLSALPIIYNPHDLLHLHFPQFFTAQTIAWRETIYPAGCHFANTVIVGSNWVKNDLIRHYRLDPEKIQIIPWAPPTQAYPDPTDEQIENVKTKYKLHQPFALYPALTWEHKNHLRLLDALVYLRENENQIVQLVCTGERDSVHWPHIEDSLNRQSLNDQVQFLGMVSPEELRCIYRLAQFVIVPTLFEAASGPVFEAWQECVPVACSNVTSLPEQVGNAALLFDPWSISEIAQVIQRLNTDSNLRIEMIKKGQNRLMSFSWERTAKAYRAIYRRAAHFPLTDEDRYLLSWDWMRDSNTKNKEEL